MNLTSLRSLGLSLALLACAASADAQRYQFSVLPTDAFGTGMWDTGSGINNAGHVVGTAHGTHERSGQLWTTPTTVVALPTSLCCTHTETYAHDINNAGWIVGQDTYRAALWINNQPSMLPELAGGRTSTAWALNDSGQVVGQTSTLAGMRATLWAGGQAIDLGTLGGRDSHAFDINSSGMVVGSSRVDATSNTEAPTLWHDGTITRLGMEGAARAINDAGLAVGDSAGFATRWEGGLMSRISNLNSLANDINNRGQVVGWALYATPDDAESWDDRQATLWTGTRAINLNSFLSQSQRDAGWVLEDALAINDLGWITGMAYNPLTYGRVPYLLSIPAIPEPASMMLLLAGLGVIGAAAHKRRT